MDFSQLSGGLRATKKKKKNTEKTEIKNTFFKNDRKFKNFFQLENEKTHGKEKEDDVKKKKNERAKTGTSRDAISKLFFFLDFSSLSFPRLFGIFSGFAHTKKEGERP